MPSVTVIIPTFNTARFICEAVESVLQQTWREFRLIVVDDGSTDNTRSLLEPYGSRIEYVYKPNGGFASALNEGIRRAGSDFVAWLSADDLFMPDKLRRQIEQMRARPEIDISYTAFYEIDSRGNRLRTLRVKPPFDEQVTVLNQLRCCYVNGSTCLFRRSCFQQVGGFDESLGLASDWEMWMRLARHFHFGYLSEPLVLYRVHAYNQSKIQRERMVESSNAVACKVIRETPTHELCGLAEIHGAAARRHAARILYQTGIKLTHVPPARRLLLWRSLTIWPWQPALVRLPGVIARAVAGAALRAVGLFEAVRRLRGWFRDRRVDSITPISDVLEIRRIQPPSSE